MPLGTISEQPQILQVQLKGHMPDKERLSFPQEGDGAGMKPSFLITVPASAKGM